MVGETARKRERRAIAYAVRTGTVQREPMTAEQTQLLLTAIDERDLARFGVRLLGKVQLDELLVLPERAAIAAGVCGSDGMTLLAYASLRGRDAFVAALLRTGANPGALFSAPRTDHAQRFVAQLPRSYAVFVVRAVARMHMWAAVAAKAGSKPSCALCGAETADNPILWAECGHGACEECQWERQVADDGGELKCMVPGCGLRPPPLASVANHVRRKNYGAEKTEPREPRDDDWVCPLCSFRNFARREKCRTCGHSESPPKLAEAPRDSPACTAAAAAAATFGLLAGQTNAVVAAGAAAAFAAVLWPRQRVETRLQRSLRKYRALPPDLDTALRQGKLRYERFRALDRAAAGKLWLGDHRQSRQEALWKAAKKGDAWRLEALVEAGVDVEERDEYGFTALFVCAVGGHAAAVRFLAGAGAEVSPIAAGGSTPIVAAASAGHQACVDALLAAGASVDEIGSAGLSARSVLAGGALAWEPVPGKLWWAIPPSADHPGAGSVVVDDAIPEAYLQKLEDLWKAIPEADGRIAKDGAHNVRSYFSDAEGWVRRGISHALQGTPCEHILPHFRFLLYDKVSQGVPPHVDLSRQTPSGAATSHSLIVYLSDNGGDAGGETSLLESVRKGAGVLADVEPKRGRMLLFPHMCPHMAKEVLQPPKLLLRGEAY
eukprot:TRINITY_DN7682_c0_g2_i1.p1 TRINITY_DN7682_c0_g2~~TRINITY_DN7682_c0_g2_i1.p1  ORF type:complete len:689 (+),score=216.80 TRINITY_DN7682_c0_g2_i1:76-2067(+)